MLARAGLGDDARLAHALRQQYLPDAVVDLVRAGMVQLVPLEPDLRTLSFRRILAQFFRQARRVVERAGTTDVVLQQVVELGLESRIRLGRLVFPLQVQDQRHQRFGNITSAELAEMPALVRLVAEGIGFALGHASAIGRGLPVCPAGLTTRPLLRAPLSRPCRTLLSARGPSCPVRFPERNWHPPAGRRCSGWHSTRCPGQARLPGPTVKRGGD